MSASPFTSAEQLDAINQLIQASPNDVGLWFARACALEDLGHFDDARTAYLQVLGRDETHFGALTNLGMLLLARDEHAVAQAFLSKAVVFHPNEAMARANLGEALAADGHSAAAIALFHESLALLGDNPQTYLGLALAAGRGGDLESAERYRLLAFPEPHIREFPYAGEGQAPRVLLVGAAGDGNVMTRLFLTDRAFHVIHYFADSYRPGAPLPEHDVVFNAIGDTDRARTQLLLAVELLARTGAPILNHPRHVLQTGRDDVMERIAGIDGVVVPRTKRYPRAAITPAQLAADGFTFPLLMRAPGFHTGRHFDFVADASWLATAVERLPGDKLYVIAYLDARRADGYARKYRIVFLNGEPYPVHAAISSDWKVHAYTADTDSSSAFIMEDADFRFDPAAAIGERAMTALRSIAARLKLEYVGVDFGVDGAGNVLVFEANATMAVFTPDPRPQFAYRRPGFKAFIDAAQAMVRAAAVPRRA